MRPRHFPAEAALFAATRSCSQAAADLAHESKAHADAGDTAAAHFKLLQALRVEDRLLLAAKQQGGDGGDALGVDD